MYGLTKLLEVDRTWVITAIIATVTTYIVKLWLAIKNYPPGPMPLPIVGNLLSFNTKVHPHSVFDNFRKQYGGIYTVWFGLEPIIVVSNWSIMKEALVTKRKDFIGRKKRIVLELQRGGHDSVVFTTYPGTNWEIMRKITISAIRKYIVTDKFQDVVCNTTDEIIIKLLKSRRHIDPEKEINLLFHNIIAFSAFGERHDQKDKEYEEVREAGETFIEEFGRGFLSDFIPILRPVFWHRERNLKKRMQCLRKIVHTKFDEHVESYVSGKTKDFTDAMIFARQEAKEEDNTACAQLTDHHLVNIIIDVLMAATHTTMTSFMWLLLILANYEEIQEKIVKEILEVIGNRKPTPKDKLKCHYTMAVITEVQRFRTIVPFGLEHSASFDSEIGGYPVKKGTAIMFDLRSHHQDSNYWPDADEFRPERFLTKENNLCQIKKDSYVPFSAGRRSCPGVKVALTEIFLVLTRFLQNCIISLPNGPNTGDLEPRKMMHFSQPKPYKLDFKPRGNSFIQL